jgi:hypothetical protein
VSRITKDLGSVAIKVARGYGPAARWGDHSISDSGLRYRIFAEDLRFRSASSRVTSASPQPIADLVEPRGSAAALELDPGRGGGAVIKNNMPVQIRA